MKLRVKPFAVSVLMAMMMAIFFTHDVCVTFAQNEVPTTEKKGKWEYYALTHAPEKSHEKVNPLATDPDARAAGEKLFEQHCAECHGRKAEGGKRGPSLRAKEVQEATPGAIFWILSNGVVRRGMPDWSKLPEPERWQIVAFIQTFRVSGAMPSSFAQSDPGGHRHSE